MTMARDVIPVVALQEILTFGFQMNTTLFQMYSDTDAVLPGCNRRNEVPKVSQYYEITIPSYNLDDFRAHFRLTRSQFDITCTYLKDSPNFNPARGPPPVLDKNLLMFLWYIGNLESFRSMADRFGVSKSTLHNSIRRTSSSLVSIMPTIITWPRDCAQCIETSSAFSERSQLQNVVGAIDGSHIPIKAPKEKPQSYYNRKKFHSVILLASCNSKLEFNYVWTGNPGSTHDATVLRSTDLFTDHANQIPNGYYLLGDSAFPILRWLITPFRDYGNLTRQQKLFNVTHSKCRQVIERAFGLLKCRFRRLTKFDVSDISVLIDSILAACVLHNICLSDDTDLPDIEETVDACCLGDQYATEGNELEGVRLRQEIMRQLVA